MRTVTNVPLKPLNVLLIVLYLYFNKILKDLKIYLIRLNLSNNTLSNKILKF